MAKPFKKPRVSRPARHPSAARITQTASLQPLHTVERGDSAMGWAAFLVVVFTAALLLHACVMLSALREGIDAQRQAAVRQPDAAIRDLDKRLEHLTKQLFQQRPTPDTVRVIYGRGEGAKQTRVLP